ncbi:hypothetical protein ACH5RR_018472 [Cinchona calisaya]|uniref:Uncharacterized protein n=1 Tax=Cinchona calisaya TaxID=153742 RepID=A0ABD2ZRP5_9GENT
MRSCGYTATLDLVEDKERRHLKFSTKHPVDHVHVLKLVSIIKLDNILRYSNSSSRAFELHMLELGLELNNLKAWLELSSASIYWEPLTNEKHKDEHGITLVPAYAMPMKISQGEKIVGDCILDIPNTSIFQGVENCFCLRSGDLRGYCTKALRRWVENIRGDLNLQKLLRKDISQERLTTREQLTLRSSMKGPTRKNKRI